MSGLEATSCSSYAIVSALFVALISGTCVWQVRAQVVSTEVVPSGSDLIITFHVTWPSNLTSAVDSLQSRLLSSEMLQAVTRGETTFSTMVNLERDGGLSIVGASYDEVSIDSRGASSALMAELSGPVATLDGIGWFRRRRVGNVTVRFASVDPVGNRLRRYRSIVVRVSGATVGQPKTVIASGLFTNSHLAVDESVLASGRVFKVPIQAEGVFKVDRAFISAVGMNPDAVDPANVQIYGNGGAPLPARNSDPRPADLQIRPVAVVGGGDGAFGSTDAVYFYARGTSGWMFDRDTGRWEHYVNPFSTANFVFVKIGSEESVTVPTTSFPAFGSPVVLGSVTGRYFVDADVFMWSKEHGSGHTWVSNPIQSGGRLDLLTSVQLPGFSGGATRLSANVAIKSNPSATVQLTWGGMSVGTIRASQVVSPGAEQPTAAASYGEFTFQAPAGPVNLTMTLQQQSNDPQAALDWLRIEYPQALVATDGLLRFAAPAAASGPTEFQIAGFNQAPIVWDITDLANVGRMAVEQRGTSWAIQANLNASSPPREFIAFSLNAARLLETESVAEVVPQNLHGITSYPTFVIFAPGLFREVADELAERRRADGLDVVVVTTDQLFNEFSGGLPDMRAARDYLKFLYDRAPGEEQLPRYALLFGDGHFDFRGLRSSVGQTPNLVLPYETEESYHPDRSYTSDDYFGLLDDDEGEWVYRGFGFTTTERVDVGIGRLPAKTVAEARLMLDKIVRYESVGSQGAWRSLYTYVADDAFTGATGSRQENDLHMQNIDAVADLVQNEAAPELNARKIYAESFERVFLNEFRIPGAKAEILNTLESGTLVLNYAGHGGPSGLAQEDIFTQDDAAALTNGDKLAVFITATCSFGWWDIDDHDSGAETLLLNPNGGAVAMLTTVRLVYTGSDTSSLNPGLNRALNREIFRKEDDGRRVRLGDAMVGTKNTTVGLLGNSRKFNLLGDPTMRLGLPAAQATVDDVNGTSVGAETGRLPALERVTLTGSVRGPDGTIDSNFDGRVELTVFDAKRRVPIRYRTYMPTPYYEVREALIWRGSVRAVGGTYTATFVVPKDISYSNDFGRISAYAVGTESEALGYTDNVIVGGTSANPPNDATGPVVALFLNDSTFVDGGLTHPDPSLIVRLFDESGINTVGAGVGHELLLVIDEDQQSAVDISSAFRSEENSFQRGTVEWDLSELRPGPGALTVRAWDVLNNSSTATLTYVVAENSDLTIRNVFNYPNPTSGRTRFVFEHNQPPGTSADVRIRIYSLNGRPIKTIEAEEVLPAGLLPGGPVMFEWDGLDDDLDRVATGIYLYKVRVEVSGPDGNRQVAERIEKLAMIR